MCFDLSLLPDSDPSTALTLWVELPKRKIKEGDTVKLRCKGNGNSPASISIGPVDVRKSYFICLLFMHHTVGSRGPFYVVFIIILVFQDELEVTDVLVLENVTRQNSGEYQCTSLDMDTIDEISATIRVDVHCKDFLLIWSIASKTFYKEQDCICLYFSIVCV